MNRKFKLGLVGAGFLGANGAIIPTLDKSFNIFSSLDISSLGGASISRKFSRGDNIELKLDSRKVERPLTKLDFSSKTTQLPSVNLETNTTNQTSFPLGEPFTESSGNSLSSNIFSVYKEIKKEEQLIKIEDKVSSKYDELVKKHLSLETTKRESSLTDFNKTKAQVQAWFKNKTDTSKAQSLNVNQRKNLQSFYELHQELNKERKAIAEEFKLVDEMINQLEGLQEALTIQGPDLQQIKNSLRVMGWGSPKIRVAKTPIKTRMHRTNDWIPWENGPFSQFYGSVEEFEKDLQALNGISAKVHKLQQSISRQKSMWGWQRATASLNQQEKEVKKLSASSQSHIELQVASKLLAFMNQLHK